MRAATRCVLLTVCLVTVLATLLHIYLSKLIIFSVVKYMTSATVDRIPYRDQFLRWDLHQPANLGTDVEQLGGRFFIYRCDNTRLCGGWADRLRGAIIGYVIANLTNRTFKAEFLKPRCDMQRYIVPNKYNWTTAVKQEPDKNVTVFSYIDDASMKLKISTMNFTEEFSPRLKTVYFLWNMDLMSGIINSSVYPDELSWMRGLSPADVYAVIYKHLFKLSPRLQNNLQEILSTNLPSNKHKLVCIHVRIGCDPSNIHNIDREIRNSLENLPKIWSFINNHSNSQFDKVFVMSDSQAVLDSAKEQSFSQRLVTVPGEIIHIDRFSGHSDAAACRGFEKLLLEHHVMMNCDLLVRSHSGLGNIAAAVRGSDKDLYCLKRKGDIVPCTRNQGTISSFWR